MILKDREDASPSVEVEDGVPVTQEQAVALRLDSWLIWVCVHINNPLVTPHLHTLDLQADLQYSLGVKIGYYSTGVQNQLLQYRCTEPGITVQLQYRYRCAEPFF